MSSLFSKPKNYLNPELFDQNNILHSSIHNKLLHRAYTIFPKEKIEHLLIIGSSIGYTWKMDSDIDINLILKQDVPEGSEFWSNVAKETNGSERLPGTMHEVNFFIHDYREIGDLDDVLGVYDLIANKWLKPPPPPHSIPDVMEQNRFAIVTAQHYETKAKDLVNKLVTNWEKFKETGDDNWKEEAKLYLEPLIDLYLEVDKQRKLQYQYGWGTPRYSDSNVIYKYLDRNKFFGIIDVLKRDYDGTL